MTKFNTTYSKNIIYLCKNPEQDIVLFNTIKADFKTWREFKVDYPQYTRRV